MKFSEMNIFLFTEWEGQTGKYLSRSHDVHDVDTERGEVRASRPRANISVTGSNELSQCTFQHMTSEFLKY